MGRAQRSELWSPGRVSARPTPPTIPPLILRDRTAWRFSVYCSFLSLSLSLSLSLCVCLWRDSAAVVLSDDIGWQCLLCHGSNGFWNGLSLLSRTCYYLYYYYYYYLKKKKNQTNKNENKITRRNQSFIRKVKSKTNFSILIYIIYNL